MLLIRVPYPTVLIVVIDVDVSGVVEALLHAHGTQVLPRVDVRNGLCPDEVVEVQEADGGHDVRVGAVENIVSVVEGSAGGHEALVVVPHIGLVLTDLPQACPAGHEHCER